MAFNPPNVPPKTPAGLLQELCTLTDLTADYKLLSTEGAVHAPTFTYNLQLEDITATASGASKKKAKHAVAKIVLERLFSEGGKFADGFASDGEIITLNSLRELFKDFDPSASANEATIPAPVEDPGNPNPVGYLQEMCIKKAWDPPLYENDDESGPPHDRVFQVSCHVERIKEIGIGKSKKFAKREAAANMVKRLQALKMIEENEKSAKEDGARAKKDLEAKFEASNKDSTNECREELRKLKVNNSDANLPNSVKIFNGKFE